MHASFFCLWFECVMCCLQAPLQQAPLQQLPPLQQERAQEVQSAQELQHTQEPQRVQEPVRLMLCFVYCLNSCLTCCVAGPAPAGARAAEVHAAGLACYRGRAGMGGAHAKKGCFLFCFWLWCLFRILFVVLLLLLLLCAGCVLRQKFSNACSGKSLPRVHNGVGPCLLAIPQQRNLQTHQE